MKQRAALKDRLSDTTQNAVAQTRGVYCCANIVSQRGADRELRQHIRGSDADFRARLMYQCLISADIWPLIDEG